MWKDLFYFTKGEKKAVFILIIIIVLLLVFTVMQPYLFAPDRAFPDNEQSKNEYLSFIDSLQLKEKRYTSDKKSYFPTANTPIQLFEFNPNTIDSASFVRLGLKPFQAKNILKYRSKGGKFRTPDDFAKVYGLSNEQFEKLKPYIQIPEQPKSEKFNASYAENIPGSSFSDEKFAYQKQEKYAPGTIIDLNLADTTELKKIPGIGSGFAKRITDYRTRLGGFYSVEQLKEVWGVSPEMYQELKNWFQIGSSKIVPIQINRLELNQLRLHPYLSYSQAKMLIELRQKKGKLQSLEQISLLEEFSEKDIERLKHYISF